MFQKISQHRLLVISLAVLSALIIMGIGVVTTDATRVAIRLPWKTPPANRVAYLVKADQTTQPPLLSAQNLERTLGTQSVTDWMQVVNLDTQAPLDAVIIGKDAVSVVNRSDLLALYQRGVVIAFIDVNAFDAATILEDPCISVNDKGTADFEGTFAITAYHVVLGEPEDAEKIKENKNGCGLSQTEGVNGKAMEFTGHSTREISDESGYNVFANDVVGFVNLVQRNKQIFAK